MDAIKEKIKLCRTCTKRDFDIQHGIVCGLTMAKPTFDKTCEKFIKDENVKPPEPDDKVLLKSSEIKSGLPFEVIEKLRLEQNLQFAVIFGIIAALIGAALWAGITVATEYQIGYMAIGVGALVGFAIRFSGKGIDQIFSIIGATLAFLGCFFGNMLSIVGFISKEYSLDFFQVFSNIEFGTIINVMIESFSPYDILFYAIAIYEGYKLSIRQITEKRLQELLNENK